MVPLRPWVQDGRLGLAASTEQSSPSERLLCQSERDWLAQWRVCQESQDTRVGKEGAGFYIERYIGLGVRLAFKAPTGSAWEHRPKVSTTVS